MCIITGKKNHMKNVHSRPSTYTSGLDTWLATFASCGLDALSIQMIDLVYLIRHGPGQLPAAFRQRRRTFTTIQLPYIYQETISTFYVSYSPRTSKVFSATRAPIHLHPMCFRKLLIYTYGSVPLDTCTKWLPEMIIFKLRDFRFSDILHLEAA